MSTTPIPSSYDEVPYINAAFVQSHPDRLATIARLFGMTPPSLASARVLELGCASGDNLIPMALSNPEATFLGIDLSQRQIEQGQVAVRRLGLTNIELRHADIMAVDASYGRFDYVVCHGIFSWVPALVRDKIFAICRDSMSPDGVAYVSYNTYPGWRMRGMIRDMMVYHARQFQGAQSKLQQARALLDFLAQSASTDTPYGLTLRKELDTIRNQPDAYLYHDHLEEVNEPVYVHQFLQGADEHGLQFLGEAEFSAMMVSNFPPQVADTLRKIAPDIVRMEQYMDFVRNRTFRQTLLVHKSVTINRTLDWKSLRGLYVASAARPASRAPSTDRGVPEQFRLPTGTGITTDNDITKAALLILGENWPQSVHIDDLVEKAREKLGRGTSASTAAIPLDADVQMLGNDLMQCFGGAIVELRSQAPAMTFAISNQPMASALARVQCNLPGPCINLKQEPVNLDPFNRKFLPLLDGTRDRDALVRELTELVRSGALEVKQTDRVLTDGPDLQNVLRDAVDENLPKLARAGLLSG